MTVKRVFLLAVIAALMSCLTVVFGAPEKEKKTKSAYITFDDGPTLNTPHILDTLDKYNAKATFFVLEERILLYPGFIKDIVSRGNAIGLHGVSHSESIYQGDYSPLEEMNRTQKALIKVTGNETKLVRVPFGSSYRLTKKQADLLSENGYILWDWNVDPRDSVGKIIPEKVLSNMIRDLKNCKDTPIILFHDRKSTAKLLDAVLCYLTENGYLLEKIDEMQKPINSFKVH